jgi:phage FluMu protein Com
MADPYALKAYGPEELLKRLGLNDTEDDDENKCSVCKNLDGTGKKYRYYERNASSVTTRYYDLLLSGNLGCTFCGWLAYAIAAQAYYELAVPNAQVQVRFGADRSVQIHEVDAAKSKEHLIILEMFTPNGK